MQTAKAGRDFLGVARVTSTGTDLFRGPARYAPRFPLSECAARRPADSAAGGCLCFWAQKGEEAQDWRGQVSAEPGPAGAARAEPADLWAQAGRCGRCRGDGDRSVDQSAIAS